MTTYAYQYIETIECPLIVLHNIAEYNTSHHTNRAYWANNNEYSA